MVTKIRRSCLRFIINHKPILKLFERTNTFRSVVIYDACQILMEQLEELAEALYMVIQDNPKMFALKERENK